MARRLIPFITALICLVGCGGSADTNNDGIITEAEFCRRTVELDCQYAAECGSLGNLGPYETLEQCYADYDNYCSYEADGCDFDEIEGRFCLDALAAEAATCEPTDQASCFEAFYDCG